MAAPHPRDDAGLLVTFDGTYVIWGGNAHRSIRPTGRSPELGARPRRDITGQYRSHGARRLPATERLRVPASRGGTLSGAGRCNRCCRSKPPAGQPVLLVPLPDGVQDRSFQAGSAAHELLTGGAAGGDPLTLVHTPQMTSPPVSTTPAGRLNFVDTAADPTPACREKLLSTDPQARRVRNGSSGAPCRWTAGSCGWYAMTAPRRRWWPPRCWCCLARPTTSTSGVITAESRESLFSAIRDANDEAMLTGASAQSVRRAGAVRCCGLAAGPARRGCGTLARDTVPTSASGHRRQRRRRRLDAQESVSHQPRQHRPAETCLRLNRRIVSCRSAPRNICDDRRSRVDRGADRHHVMLYVRACAAWPRVLPADGHRRACWRSPDDSVDARSPGVSWRRGVVDIFVTPTPTATKIQTAVCAQREW